MRGHHDRGALLQRELDAGHGGADARVVGDGAAVVLRHVQVGADEDALAAEFLVREALELHYFAWCRATVTSSMRLEKPHSLSYQLATFTSVPPETLVSNESTIELAGWWLKSEDTSGSVVYSRMPLSAPSAAFFSTAFTSST